MLGDSNNEENLDSEHISFGSYRRVSHYYRNSNLVKQLARMGTEPPLLILPWSIADSGKRLTEMSHRKLS